MSSIIEKKAENQQSLSERVTVGNDARQHNDTEEKLIANSNVDDLSASVRMESQYRQS